MSDTYTIKTAQQRFSAVVQEAEDHPVTGRWLSRDPIGEDGGINIYEYAGNDPIDNTDPTGLICLRSIDVTLPIRLRQTPSMGGGYERLEPQVSAQPVDTVCVNRIGKDVTFSTAYRVGDQDGYKASGKQYAGVMLTHDCLGKTESYKVFSGGNIDHHPPYVRMGNDTSIPYGNFNVQTKLKGVGFPIFVTPNRACIEIHIGGVTTGCIAVAASFDQFTKDMQDTAHETPISVNYHMTDGNPPPQGNGN